jgi:hypothetical protein
VSALVGAGAITAARTIVNLVTRGGIAGETDWLLAPLWKLPPEVRGQLRAFWTQPTFFEALGSQIEMMSVSSRETLDSTPESYGALPLITISSTNPGDHRMRQQDALAQRSSQGRHLVASNSSHWIPLDEPAIVVQAIRDVLAIAETS